MDFEKLGIMGHSLGGATAINVMYNNNAFKAEIDMDGYLYREERKEVLDKPLLIMNGKLKNPEIEDSPNIAYTEQERRKVVIEFQ